MSESQMAPSRAILLLCPDVISESMAGPAIRYWEFAKSLAPFHSVTLAAPNEIPGSFASPSGVRLLRHEHENIARLCAAHDIIIFQGDILVTYPILRHTEKILIADMYDPLPLEGLEQHKGIAPGDALPHYSGQVRIINEAFKLADYFLCASDRQRDLWLGTLLALGRINPFNYADAGKRLVSVPFGLPNAPPRRSGSGFRQSVDGAGFVLLWGGGIWEWFDPLSVIRAVHCLADEYPDLRLVFLGTRHPNPVIPVMPMLHRAESLARESGLYGKQVIFRPGWARYNNLQNHLLDADVGVSAHFDTLETRFSFRTRILHYLWAGKPVITTGGDVLAEAIADHSAGIVVDYADERSWVKAIRKLRDRDFYNACIEGVGTLAGNYRWTNVTRPLHAICANACRAADITLEQGERALRVYDCEHEQALLKKELDRTTNSRSWKLTRPLREIRRQIKRGKG
ncbi:MAG: glycosyltransferase family 4 protein [Gammaproteobacteria bacterium]|nr:glycosyltransferase family 4 protein [Gammaproteobacteria bacterium]